MRRHRVPPSSSDPSNPVPFATQAGGESLGLMRFLVLRRNMRRPTTLSTLISSLHVVSNSTKATYNQSSQVEHHTLGIRHRELASYLPLTALGVTAGGATIQQNLQSWRGLRHEPEYLPIHGGQTRGSLLRFCSGPAQNNAPNDKF